MDQIPLSHEPSAGDTNKQVIDALPHEVVQCLENARFVRTTFTILNSSSLSKDKPIH